jgi:hypothetical protein
VPVVDEEALVACLHCMLASDPDLRDIAAFMRREEWRNLPAFRQLWDSLQKPPAA